jgi:hypothetical protein
VGEKRAQWRKAFADQQLAVRFARSSRRGDLGVERVVNRERRGRAKADDRVEFKTALGCEVGHADNTIEALERVLGHVRLHSGLGERRKIEQACRQIGAWRFCARKEGIRLNYGARRECSNRHCADLTKLVELGRLGLALLLRHSNGREVFDVVDSRKRRGNRSRGVRVVAVGSRVEQVVSLSSIEVKILADVVGRCTTFCGRDLINCA